MLTLIVCYLEFHSLPLDLRNSFFVYRVFKSSASVLNDVSSDVQTASLPAWYCLLILIATFCFGFGPEFIGRNPFASKFGWCGNSMLFRIEGSSLWTNDICSNSDGYWFCIHRPGRLLCNSLNACWKGTSLRWLRSTLIDLRDFWIVIRLIWFWPSWVSFASYSV